MKRDLNGIFLLDKPLGGSSNHALQRVKRLFNAVKAGHTGSLDPLATGMLPICLGEATKFSQHLLDANKTYEVTAMLGVRTDTGDSEGRIIDSCNDFSNDRGLIQPQEGRRPLVAPTRGQLNELLQKFTGTIQQVPPMHSALKHKGRPLYEYARKGEVIDRPARTVTIFSLEVIDDGQVQDLPLQTISLRVHCSKGTYIRSLIDDIGEALGCGAHVIALRRTMVEPFNHYPMITFEELEASGDRDQYLLPIDAALSSWPKQILADEISKRLLQGQSLSLAPSSPPSFVCFYTESGQFLGVGAVNEKGEVVNKRLVSTDFLRLFSR